MKFIRPIFILILCGLLFALKLVAAPPPPKTPQPPPDDPLKRLDIPLQPPPRTAFENGRFNIRPGEVIVFTGPTHMVFEQQQGWMETALTAAAQDQHPIFRHMCWEGDSVYAQPREFNFGTWQNQFDAVHATTVFTWFGQVEAMDDSHSEADFEKAYEALMDEFKSTVPRVVVLGPLPFFKPGSPDIPDNSWRNSRVRKHSEIAAKLASERGLVFVDLFSRLIKPVTNGSTKPGALSENGIHLSEAGQLYVSAIAVGLLQNAEFNAPTKAPPTGLRKEVIAKNRLWFDAWRTMNWAFAYGDRTTQMFGQGIDGRPKFAIELEEFKPLIANADARIRAIALGRTPPPVPQPLPDITPTPEEPQIEQSTLRVRDGFQFNLFASEANGLVKPLQIRWDTRGRLWAACAPTYPQIVPGIRPNDYLLVCEDTDGDGQADKFTKFAEGLTMPMGMEFGDGGVYVCEATQLVFLRDTDGDGKADQRKVILSGFGTGDAHQLINSLRWAPDGRLWFSQGLHINARVETPWGLAQMDKAGIWQFNPRTLQLRDFFGGAQAGANCWGVVFDDWGQVFHIAADNRMAFYSVPGLVPVDSPERYYEIGPLAVSKVKGMELEILGGRSLPEELQGALVKSTYFMNSVFLYKLVDDGAGFRTEELGELITSSETAFRPVQTLQGPDGGIYVCDWFNPVIGHYQASYRDPKRDKVHGRVWRITPKDRALTKAPLIADLKPAALLDQLLSPERMVREQARIELFNRPKGEVIPAADAWLKQHASSPEALREVIGVYAAHEAYREDVLQKLLDSPEPRLRAWGSRFIGLWADRLKSPLDLATKMITDSSARVRLETVVASSYIAKPEAIEVATKALDQPHDRFIDYALRATTRFLQPLWQPALASGKLNFNGSAEHLAFAMQAVASKETTGLLRQLAADAKLSADSRRQLLAALANAGEPDDLAFVLQKGTADPLVLEELAVSAAVRGKRPSGDTWGPVKGFIESKDNALRMAGFKLAGAWKLQSAVSLAASIANNAAENDAIRASATAAFATLKGTNAVAGLETLATAASPTVALAAVTALAPLNLKAAATHAARAISAVRDDQQAAVLLRGFLTRKDGGDALASALTTGKPSADGAKLTLQALNTIGREEPKLRDVLYKAAGLVTTEPPAYSAELVNRLVSEARTKGNARNGEAVFGSAVVACQACHKVGNNGGTIGPDLSAIGRGMTPELIVESVLWPKRQIKEGFFLTSVTSADENISQGYIVGETANELTLRDPATNLQTRVAKKSIKERQDSGTPMPEGLIAPLTAGQVTDLLAYLMALGK